MTDFGVLLPGGLSMQLNAPSTALSPPSAASLDEAPWSTSQRHGRTASAGGGGHGHSHGQGGHDHGHGGHGHSHGEGDGLLQSLLFGAELSSQPEMLDATDITTVLEHWEASVRRVLPRALLIGFVLTLLCAVLFRISHLSMLPPAYGAVREIGQAHHLDRPTPADRRFAVYLNALRMSPQTYHRLLEQHSQPEPGTHHRQHERERQHERARQPERRHALPVAASASEQSVAPASRSVLAAGVLEVPRFQPVDPVYINSELSAVAEYSSQFPPPAVQIAYLSEGTSGISMLTSTNTTPQEAVAQLICEAIDGVCARDDALGQASTRALLLGRYLEEIGVAHRYLRYEEELLSAWSVIPLWSRITPTRSPIYSGCDEQLTPIRLRFLASYKDTGDEPPIEQMVVVNQQAISMYVLAGEAARGTFAAEIDVTTALDSSQCAYYYFRFVDSRDRVHHYPTAGNQLLFSGSASSCGEQTVVPQVPVEPVSKPTSTTRI
mmetsp:Transcript_14631/g.43929  ORF Transcript_14631/g.43929 Transcript_14631/m.43929 type:complete len:494 (-) Transcript_14631:101-1582(-)